MYLIKERDFIVPNMSDQYEKSQTGPGSTIIPGPTSPQVSPVWQGCVGSGLWGQRFGFTLYQLHDLQHIPYISGLCFLICKMEILTTPIALGSCQGVQNRLVHRTYSVMISILRTGTNIIIKRHHDTLVHPNLSRTIYKSSTARGASHTVLHVISKQPQAVGVTNCRLAEGTGLGGKITDQGYAKGQ